MPNKQKVVKQNAPNAKQIQLSPIKLYPELCPLIVKHYRHLIEEHGLAYTTSMALADHFRSLGYAVPALAAPKDRIRDGQRRRWKKVKASAAASKRAIEAAKAKRRQRDQARRAKQAQAKPEGD